METAFSRVRWISGTAGIGESGRMCSSNTESLRSYALPRMRSPMRMRASMPAQWPIMIHASGRSTASESVMVFAFEGPTPMLIMVMPSPSSVTRS